MADLNAKYSFNNTIRILYRAKLAVSRPVNQDRLRQEIGGIVQDCSSRTFSISDFAQKITHLFSGSQLPVKRTQVTCGPFLSPKGAEKQGIKRAYLCLTAPNVGTNGRLSITSTKICCRSGWTLAKTTASKPTFCDFVIGSTHEFPPSGLSYPQPTELDISDRISASSGSLTGLPLGLQHPLFKLHTELAISFRSSGEPNTEVLPLEIAIRAFELADAHTSYDRLLHVDIQSGPDWTKRMTQGETPLELTDNELCLSFSRTEYERVKSNRMPGRLPNGQHRAYIALGSNVGDRVKNIETACQRMNDRGICVLRTSALYETKPMYLEDQQQFINGVCEIDTTLDPPSLLKQLKEIEMDLGRVKVLDNGPRTIDLDILLYGKEVVHTDFLIIPHQKMMEREFVLRPLCDLVPHATLPDASPILSFRRQLERLPNADPPLSPLTPLSSSLAALSSQSPTRQTHLMAVLNLTPDSFSDGGLHSPTDPSSLLPNLRKQVDQKRPLTILDIGGQSTRPHAPQVPQEEEIARILPTIRAIRSDRFFRKLAISVDTYRTSVANSAIEAGADIVNDVSAGQMDPEMLPTIARLGCTCVLMHMRGTPDTMMKLTDYPSGIIEGVGSELLGRVGEAQKAGIRRWRIILDPGIGFAKTQAQNLELLRRFDELRNFEGLQGFPWVVGVSRKSFIGKITGVEEASERKWGTAACVVAAVKGGADIVRVHDAQEMGQVVAMADALWRV
ncbi:MAG: hypothetical protein Q9217_005490 [Psora testacea]